MLGHRKFQYSFGCQPISTAYRNFCMYNLMIFRELVSKGISHQSFFEVTRLFSPTHVFKNILQGHKFWHVCT